MTNQLISVILIGLLACFGLGFYALYLWRKVWQHKKILARHEAKNREHLAADLRVLLTSLFDEQAALGAWVELCIRIKVILEHYDYELSQQDDYRVFQLVYQVCENIPTHQAWKDLPKSERRAYEAGFIGLEEEHKADSHNAARKLQKLLEQP